MIALRWYVLHMDIKARGVFLCNAFLISRISNFFFSYLVMHHVKHLRSEGFSYLFWHWLECCFNLSAIIVINKKVFYEKDFFYSSNGVWINDGFWSLRGNTGTNKNSSKT